MGAQAGPGGRDNLIDVKSIAITTNLVWVWVVMDISTKGAPHR